MLHQHLVHRIERLIGEPIESCNPVEGGYTPAMRLLCETSKGHFFVKVGTTPLTSQWLRREIDVYNRVSGYYMPNLIGWDDHESEPILVVEDLSTHHWPPPWSERQIDVVLAQIHAMHNTSAKLEPYEEVYSARGPNWEAVALDPKPFLSLGMADERWLDTALPLLLQYEAQCSTEGDSLAHWDLRSDNICVTESRAVFVDWNLACLSNPQLDLGFWLPSLAYEGGPEPERILPHAPEVAAWVSGFFAARAGLPEIPDAPHVRLVQRQQLETALPWVVRALDLPTPRMK